MADAEDLAELYDRLEAAAGPLPDVHRKKMFGCQTLFAGEHIFGLIWKTGRIGVKLPDAAVYAEALALKGAKGWAPDEGKKPMAHWVLLPEAVADDPAQLAPWVAKAHAMALAAPPKPAKPAKAPKKPRSGP